MIVKTTRNTMMNDEREEKKEVGERVRARKAI